MKTQITCGKMPVLKWMAFLRHFGWKTPPAHHDPGGETGETGVTTAGRAVVSGPLPPTLDAVEKKFLLDLARTTLRCAAATGGLPPMDGRDVPPKLAETKACFVTLRANGALRGCIGHVFPREPLYRAVADNARSAGRHDPRFRPVQPGEVDKIKIEISVLTEPQPLRFNSPDDLLGQLKPHEDGVVLKVGLHTATFLPQVWEQICDRTEFLNQLAEKAGCPPSAWRDADASISIYHVEAFEESGGN